MRFSIILVALLCGVAFATPVVTVDLRLTLEADGGYTEFLKLVDELGQQGLLTCNDEYTLFAPVDAAVLKIKQKLGNNREKLIDWVKSLFLKGKQTKENIISTLQELKEKTEQDISSRLTSLNTAVRAALQQEIQELKNKLTTLNGKLISAANRVNGAVSTLVAQGGAVIGSVVEATNGLVYKINDAVVQVPKKIAAHLTELGGQVAALIEKIKTVPLGQLLYNKLNDASEKYTVIMPSPEKLTELLNNPDILQVVEQLKQRVLKGCYTFQDLRNVGSVETLAGGTLTVTQTGSNTVQVGSIIITSDTAAKVTLENGTVHNSSN